MSPNFRLSSVLGGLLLLALAVSTPASAAPTSSGDNSQQSDVIGCAGSGPECSQPLYSDVTCGALSPTVFYAELHDGSRAVILYANRVQGICTTPVATLTAAHPAGSGSGTALGTFGAVAYSSTP